MAELIEASENLSPHRTDPIFFENSAKENSPTWVVVLAHVVKDNTFGPKARVRALLIACRVFAFVYCSFKPKTEVR